MPGENIQDWSVIATNNSNADSSIGWAEGQARASVNDSARSMMAAHAKHRNLNNGSIVTGGTANAQTFTSGVTYTVVPTGLRVLLKIGPALTNTTAATLNMDGLGDTAIKTADGLALTGGELVADSYTELLYNGSNWVFLYSREGLVTGLNAGLATKVAKAGDTMTGALTVPGITCTGALTVASNITVAGALTAAGLDVQGVAQSHGYATRSGLTGGYGPSYFNIQYSGGASLLFMDDTNVGTFAFASDYRIKKDVIDLPGMWDTVKELRPIKYTQAQFSPSFQADEIERWGFIAHELQATLTPSAASGVKDQADVIQSPNPFTLIAALTKALQEAMTRIEALEAR